MQKKIHLIQKAKKIYFRISYKNPFLKIINEISHEKKSQKINYFFEIQSLTKNFFIS